jgi:hypothetical protein
VPTRSTDVRGRFGEARVAVEATPGARLRVATIPHAHVDGKDGWLVLGPPKRDSGEQVAQGLGVYGSMGQSGVEAAPSATMGRLEAEVDGRRYGLGGEEGVGKVEESVGPTVEALVERVAEGAKGVKSVVRFHDALIMHSLTAYRTLQPPAGLKRKLRARFKTHVGDN